MKYYLPIHLDGDNRGCEAITKSTSQILGCRKEDIIAYSSNIQLDTSLGLDQCVTLQARKPFSLLFKVEKKAKLLFVKEPYKRALITYKYIYDDFINVITPHDVVLSTGGDMLCYGNNEVIYTNETLYARNVKTILWGCSVDRKALTPEKIETLKKFSLIYARESLTKELLEEELGLENVCLFPDPAFILLPEKYILPDCFNSSDVIGMNLSNFISGSDDFKTCFWKSLFSMINYILDETNFNILLIPHVLWKGQDDRIISNSVYDRFKNSGRISILNIQKMSYCQIRYVISKCRFFIGARTHSVISAYSTSVPTLALGYSIKSHGIAKDLGLPKETIVDCINLNDEKELMEKFVYLQDNEQILKKHLQKVVPEYMSKVWNVMKCMERIIAH